MHDLQMLGVQVPGARKGQSSSMVHHVPLSSDLKRNDAKLIKILTHQDDKSYGNVKSPANVSNLKDFVKVMADDVSSSKLLAGEGADLHVGEEDAPSDGREIAAGE